MGQVEKRWPPLGTCVYDLENGLKKPIQVHHWPSIALKLKGLVSLVPPGMRRTVGEGCGLSRTRCDSAPITHRRSGTDLDAPLLILREVNVQRWSLPMRRERPRSVLATLRRSASRAEG